MINEITATQDQIVCFLSELVQDAQVDNSSCNHLPKPQEGNRQTYQNIIVVCTKNRLILIFMSVITKINKLILLHANLFNVLKYVKEMKISQYNSKSSRQITKYHSIEPIITISSICAHIFITFINSLEPLEVSVV